MFEFLFEFFSGYNLFFQCCKNLFYKVLSFQTQTYKPLKLFFSGLNYGRKLTPYVLCPASIPTGRVTAA